MLQLIQSTLVSLDGVIEDPATWVGITDHVDDHFERGALERLLENDAMVMGRGTYEVLFRDWGAVCVLEWAGAGQGRRRPPTCANQTVASALL